MLNERTSEAVSGLCTFVTDAMVTKARVLCEWVRYYMSVQVPLRYLNSTELLCIL